MIVLVEKTFDRDVKKIKYKSLLFKLADVIENLQSTESISTIENLKKLKGYQNYYRIKLSFYRLGIIIQDNEITLVRFLHRKDIYNEYP